MAGGPTANTSLSSTGRPSGRREPGAQAANGRETGSDMFIKSLILIIKAVGGAVGLFFQRRFCGPARFYTDGR